MKIYVRKRQETHAPERRRRQHQSDVLVLLEALGPATGGVLEVALGAVAGREERKRSQPEVQETVDDRLRHLLLRADHLRERGREEVRCCHREEGKGRSMGDAAVRRPAAWQLLRTSRRERTRRGERRTR